MKAAAGWVDGSWVTVDLDHYGGPDQAVFDPARLDEVQEMAGGRGPAWSFSHRGLRYVLRRYRRGGLLGSLLKDRYPRMPLDRTRPAREWRALRQLRSLGLPVPPPAAWRIVPTAGVLYRADLVTGMIADSRSLLATLAERPLDEGEWRRVGATLARFFRAGLRHPDLNAGNVLLDGGGGVHLVDFDRARLRPPLERAAWDAMVGRLARSLRKGRRLNPGLRCGEGDIAILRSACLEGFEAARH